MRWWAVIAVALGCGARTEISQPDGADATMPPAPNAIFHFYCNGPEALAFQISMGDPVPACDQPEILPNQYVLNLREIQPDLVPAGTMTFTIDPLQSGHVIDSDTCVGSTETCDPASSGSFTVVDFDPHAAFSDGYYDVRFHDRAPIAGTFHASRCPNFAPLPCTDAGL